MPLDAQLHAQLVEDEKQLVSDRAKEVGESLISLGEQVSANEDSTGDALLVVEELANVMTLVIGRVRRRGVNLPPLPALLPKESDG